jgi:excisionase family DNA binding protein
MPLSKLLSVAQLSAKLQCARSTVRKLVVNGELHASRISHRTIRVSESDLQAYLDSRATYPRQSQTQRYGSPMTNEQLAAILAERVMGWTVGPERYMMGGRRWIPRWRFQPIEKLEDAFRLLEEAMPQEYSIRGDDKGNIQVQVRIAGTAGEAHGTSRPLVITLAIARAVGVDVER